MVLFCVCEKRRGKKGFDLCVRRWCLEWNQIIGWGLSCVHHWGDCGRRLLCGCEIVQWCSGVGLSYGTVQLAWRLLWGQRSVDGRSGVWRILMRKCCFCPWYTVLQVLLDAAWSVWLVDYLKMFLRHPVIQGRCGPNQFPLDICVLKSFINAHTVVSGTHSQWDVKTCGIYDMDEKCIENLFKFLRKEATYKTYQ